ncbi:hypothetical protein Tco_0102502, partial [Tanacetum coccineum]
ILPAGRMVSAGWSMVLLVVIFPAGRLVSAGCTMVLLVVIFPAGRLVSAGCTMVLLEVIVPAGFFVPAGSYGLCCCHLVSADDPDSAGGSSFHPAGSTPMSGSAVPDTAGGPLDTTGTASTVPTSAAMDSAASHHELGISPFADSDDSSFPSPENRRHKNFFYLKELLPHVYREDLLLLRRRMNRYFRLNPDVDVGMDL